IQDRRVTVRLCAASCRRHTAGTAVSTDATASSITAIACGVSLEERSSDCQMPTEDEHCHRTSATVCSSAGFAGASSGSTASRAGGPLFGRLLATRLPPPPPLPPLLPSAAASSPHLLAAPCRLAPGASPRPMRALPSLSCFGVLLGVSASYRNCARVLTVAAI